MVVLEKKNRNIMYKINFQITIIKKEKDTFPLICNRQPEQRSLRF